MKTANSIYKIQNSKRDKERKKKSSLVIIIINLPQFVQ